MSLNLLNKQSTHPSNFNEINPSSSFSNIESIPSHSKHNSNQLQMNQKNIKSNNNQPSKKISNSSIQNLNNSSYIKQNQSVIDTLIDNYKEFYNILKPLSGIRAKKLTLFDLKFITEEIYSWAFVKFTQFLKSKNHKKNQDIQNNVNEFPSFPMFVFKLLSEKYENKKLIDQHCMDMLLSLYKLKDENYDVFLFSSFLNQSYSFESLIFFLFLRSNIEKELNFLFFEKAKEETVIQHKECKEDILMDIYLTKKNITKIIKSVYNFDDNIIINQIFYRLSPYMEQKKNIGKCINSSMFLYILVEDFNKSRKQYKECQDISNYKLIFNKQNEFFEMVESDNDNNNNQHDMFLNMLYYFKENSKDNINDTIINIIITYIKEKEILIYFEKFFEKKFGNNLNKNDELFVYQLRDIIVKKIYFLINIIFYEDSQGWFASFSEENEGSKEGGEVNEEENELNCNSNIDVNEENEKFYKFVELKNQIITCDNILELQEDLIEKFCAGLLSYPLLSKQISKLILNNKNKLSNK